MTGPGILTVALAFLLSLQAADALGTHYQCFDINSRFKGTRIRRILFDGEGSTYFFATYLNPDTRHRSDPCTDTRFRLIRHDASTDSFVTVQEDFPRARKIAFDRQNNLWILRRVSLFRYRDGVEEHVLDVPSHGRSHVDFAVGGDGAVWICGEGCLFKVHEDLAVTDLGQRNPSLPRCQMRPIHITESGDVWIGLASGNHDSRYRESGLFALQVHGDDLILHAWPSAWEGPPIYGLSRILSDVRGVVWIAARTQMGNGRLLSFDGTEWAQYPIDSLDKAISRTGRTCIHGITSDNERLWVLIGDGSGVPIQRLWTYNWTDSTWADAPHVHSEGNFRHMVSNPATRQIWIEASPRKQPWQRNLHRIRY